MAIRIQLKGNKKIIANYIRKTNELKREKEYIFYEPLQKIVNEIRKQIVLGRHIFTRELFSNTKKTVDSKNSPDGYTMNMEFGYMTPHGATLELGSGPHHEPLGKMIAWVGVKSPGMDFQDQVSAALRIQKKLADVGSNANPIIVPVWESMQKEYMSEVENRLAEVWNK